MEQNPAPSQLAVRIFHSASRPTHDIVRVDTSARAPGHYDVIVICDSDPQHMASAMNTQSPTSLIQLAPSLFRSLLLFLLWPRQSEPPSAAAPPEAADLLWSFLCLAARHLNAELGLSRKMDRECCFQQQGFPTHCSLIRDQRATDLWPGPLTPLWVCVCVCLCVPPGDSEQCGNGLLTAVKAPNYKEASHREAEVLIQWHTHLHKADDNKKDLLHSEKAW